MKQFFKFFFASMLGFIVGSILLVFILTSIVAGLVSSFSTKDVTTVKPSSVLTLSMNYVIPEQTDADPFRSFSFSDMKSKVNLGLNDILKNIEKAKTDDNIKGIYISSGTFPSGNATAEQVRNALIDFKQSKKFIVSYAELYSQKGYYVASVADKIFLNPQGLVEYKGLGTQIMFFKGLMEKLGVEAQVFYDGKFKTATEPFRYDKMSEPNKIMTLSLLNDVQNHFQQKISEARNLPVTLLDSIANNLLIRNSGTAKSYGLVDNIYYDDEVQQYIADQLKIEKKEKINFISLNKYNQTPDNKKYTLDMSKVAILYAQGDIVDGEGEDDNIGSARLLKEISKLRKDDKVKAIVLRVNSPGGSVMASEVIWREVSITNSVKPVVVSMGDYAASGGYYISCNASKIIAQPNTLTGSIGVFGILPNMKKFFNDKLGITFDGVGTGKYSDFGNLSRPLREDEKLIIQNEIDSIYADFKRKVANGRKLPIEKVDSIAQGRVWTGSQALQLGLVDTLGNINDAVTIAAKLANLKDYRVTEYPQRDNKFSKIFEILNDDMNESIMKEKLGEYYSIYKKLESLTGMKGIQARMLFEYDIN